MYKFWFALFYLDSLLQGLVCVPVLVERGTLKPPCNRPLPGSRWGEKERKVLSSTYRSYSARSCIRGGEVAGTEVPEWGSKVIPLCIEVCTHQKLVTPSYSYCLTSNFPRRACVVTGIISPTFPFSPVSWKLSVLPSIAIVLRPYSYPVLELTVYWRSRERGAIYKFRLWSVLPTSFY